MACALIGLITFGFSAVGVVIGKNAGTWLEGKAEIFSGTVLILMGLKFLLGY